MRGAGGSNAKWEGQPGRTAKALVLHQYAPVRVNTQFPSYFSVNVSKQQPSRTDPQCMLFKSKFPGLTGAP